MTGRVLRIELRRSAALWIGLLVAVLGLALMYLLSGPWWKGSGAWNLQWNGLALWQRTQLVFLLPLVLGAGLIQGLREPRSRIGELLLTTPRPRWQRGATTGGAMAIGLVVGYLALWAVGAVQVATHTSYFDLAWLPVVAAGILSVVAAGVVGMGISRLAPWPWLAPVLAVACLVSGVVAQMAQTVAVLEGKMPHPAALLSPVPATLTRNAFEALSTSVSLAQVLWFAGLVVTGLLLLAASTSRTRLAAVLPAILAAAAALPIVSTQDKLYVIDASATEPVCAQGTPRVCVTRAHAAALADFVGPARDALALLAKLPDPPTSVEEVPATDHGGIVKHDRPQRPDAVLVDFEWSDVGTNGNLRPGTDDVRLGVLAGAGTWSCEGRDWDQADYVRERAARTVATAWLSGELRPLRVRADLRAQVDALASQAWQTLRSLPEEEQRARVAEFRRAALACQGDLLGILTKGDPR